MTTRLALLLAAALLGFGCAHATETRSQEEAKGKAKPQESDDAKNGKKDPAAAADKPDPKNVKSVTPPKKETLTTSKTTEQMFKPEGIRQLQDKLAVKMGGLKKTGELDDETQEALRGVQKHYGLPTTGLPDYETLRRLGLKPEDVYQHQTPGERVGVQ